MKILDTVLNAIENDMYVLCISENLSSTNVISHFFDIVPAKNRTRKLHQVATMLMFIEFVLQVSVATAPTLIRHICQRDGER